MGNIVKTKNISIGQGSQLVLISGPCVIENYEITYEIASFLKELTQHLDIPFIFKASYDKANRTSINSFRGPGLADGLDILERIKTELGITIISDVHRINEIDDAARVLDIIQIPAFLCRQTDFILKVAETGKPINVKKGQFLSPWDVKNIVVDFRAIKIMQDMGYPVIFDATHSIQLPGGAGKSSGGQREFAPILARAAVAAGADGIFMEVHPEPDRALCDGPNSLKLDTLDQLLSQLIAIRKAMVC